MDLIEAIQPEKFSCAAFTGAGGKTTAMFWLARQFNRKVIVSATTHLAEAQLALADAHFTVKNSAAVEKAFRQIVKEPPGKVFLFTGALGADSRTAGLAGETLDRLYALSSQHHLPLLIEADGSRQKPLKAPGTHEPAIPPFADTVIVVAGLKGLGKPLSEEWVHRPEIFALLSGLPGGAKISPEALARVLTHPAGGLKNIPVSARRIALLNQADSPHLKRQGRRVQKLIAAAYDAVVITSLLN